MDDELTCTECGSKISSNLRYCPNCKCNVESKESKKPQKSSGSHKIINHPAWGILQIIVGSWLLVMGSEWYFQIMGLVFLGFGIHTLYKHHKKKNQENTNQ